MPDVTAPSVTWHEFLLQKLDAERDHTDGEIGRLRLEVVANKELNTEKFRSRDNALEVALATTEKRLEGMNEFRASNEANAARSVGQQEYKATREAMEARLNKIENQQSKWTGGLIMIGVAIPVLSGIVSWFVSGLRLAH
jgi:hypothetical protein